MKTDNKIPGLMKSVRAVFRLVVLMCIFLLHQGLMVLGQNPSFSITASARVVDVAEIELITISDLQIDLNMAVNGFIYINPFIDSQAGVVMVKGKASAYARITFESETKLQNRFGKGEMIFTYEVNGYLNDNQHASEPLDAVERMIRLNEDGHYYLWIGGRIDVSNARPGSYAGEFTLEIEYI